MMPRDRAAQCKPCKKQAPASSEDASSTDNFSNTDFDHYSSLNELVHSSLSNFSFPKSPSLSSQLSKLSSSSSSIPSHTSGLRNKPHNPYQKNKAKKPAYYAMRSILNQDDAHNNKPILKDSISSLELSSQDSKDSSFSASDLSSVPQPYIPSCQENNSCSRDSSLLSQSSSKNVSNSSSSISPNFSTSNEPKAPSSCLDDIRNKVQIHDLDTGKNSCSSDSSPLSRSTNVSNSSSFVSPRSNFASNDPKALSSRLDDTQNQTFQIQDVATLLKSLSSQTEFQNEQSQTLLHRLQAKCNSYAKKQVEFDARTQDINNQLDIISHHQSILRNTEKTISITLGQTSFSSSSVSDQSVSSQSSLSFKKQSKYNRLNWAGEPDEADFLSQDPSAGSYASSPLYCPVEEISAIEKNFSKPIEKPVPSSIFLRLGSQLSDIDCEVCNSKSSSSDASSHSSRDSLELKGSGLYSQEIKPEKSFASINDTMHTSLSPTQAVDANINVPNDCNALSDEDLGSSPEQNEVFDDIHNENFSPTVALTPLPTIITSHTIMDKTDTKYEGDIRIISQNCRGALQNEKSKDEHYIPSMESFHGLLADVVLLNETNVDWRIRDNHYDTHLANRVIWSPSPIKTTTASCKWENRERSNYQPGGVLSMFANHVTPRIIASVSDRYGRWTKTTIQVKRRNIVIFNTYRTHMKTLEMAGRDTPWMQQWTAHRESTGEDSDPRYLHIDDLIADIQCAQDNEDYVLVIGDFNEDLSDSDHNGIKKLQDQCRLVQAYEYIVGITPSSRQNNRKIFHTFMSPELIQYVRKIGVCTENDGFVLSDHIPFFLDLKSELFDTKIQPVLPLSSRILRMYDVIKVSEYVKLVLEQFRHHNICKRLDKLKEFIKSHGFNQEAMCSLEKLDSHVTQIRIHCEKGLIKKPTQYKYTDIAKNQVTKIRLLQRLKKKWKNGKQTDDILSKLQSFEFCFEITQENISSTLTQERQLLKQIQADIELHREEYLEKLCERAAAEKDKETAIIMKEIKNREKQKRSWQKISYVTKSKSNGVSRLGIPRGFENKSTKEIWDFLQTPYVDPDFIYITDPKEIESRLIEWQYLHYMQASETPLADKYWYDKLNPNNITDIDIRDILEGKILDDPAMHSSSKCFFQEITSNIIPSMPDSIAKVSVDKFKKFYTKTKESTASSPSGLHLGHWKAAATNDTISKVLSTIIEIATENSYTLKRWKRVVGVLMEKTRGKPTIHKFRTIHIIESDLNFVMRLLWGKSMMNWSEQNNALHENQYGGRKGIQAQSAALNKTLTLDVVRYYGEDATIVDNDAQACYDRIIPVVLAYALLRLGLPVHLVRFQCKWLEQASYELKLNNSSLSRPYSSNVDKYLFGTGQGTGWSPPSWTSLSDLVSRIMERHTPGIKLVQPNGEAVARVLDAFVDDTNGGLTEDGFKDFIPPPPTAPVCKCDTIFHQTETNVQFYSRLLFTTGGRLALHKCAIILLRTIWKQGKRTYENTHLHHRPLNIQQGINQDVQQIKLASPHDARRMLGVYVAPDGNCNLQEKLLRSKSEKWSSNIKHNHMRSFEVLMSYHQGVMKSLEFPVGACLLSESQCNRIQSPALTTCLQKNGVLSTLSRAIVYGPSKMCGLNFKNLYTESGIQKIELLIGHTRKMDKTGQILQVALGCLQQEIGVTDPVLSLPFNEYKSIATKSWMVSLWSFLHDISGSIKHTDVWVPVPKFCYDVNIMEQVLHRNYTEAQRYKINMCRLFKKVYFVGELLDITGTKLKPDILDLTKPGFHNDKFPRIQLPISFHELWRSVVRDLIATTKTGKNLGEVAHVASFQYCLDESRKVLLQYEKHVVKHCYLQIYDNKYQKCPSTLFFNLEPAYVAEVSKANANIIVRKSRPIAKKSNRDSSIFPNLISPSDSFTSFRQYLRMLPQVHQRNIGEITQVKWFEFLHDFRRGNIIGVADASVNFKQGCQAYILENKSEQSHIQGKAPVDADVDDITSNRAETCGVLAIITLTTALAKFLHVSSNIDINVYCDNTEALRRPNVKHKTYTRMVSADMDVKLEILDVMAISPISYKFLHVKGHADDDPDFDYDSANQQTKRNIDMDIVAKNFLQSPPPTFGPTSNPLYFPAQKACLQILGINMIGDIRKQIYLYRHGSSLEDHIQSSLSISSKTMEKIEWDGLQRAFSKLSAQDQISRMKIFHQKWPTRVLLKTRKEIKEAQCLRCRKCPEDFLHIFQCTNVEAKQAHQKQLHLLREKLKKYQTHHLIIHSFCQILSKSQKGLRLSFTAPLLGNKDKIELTRQVFRQQVSLGAFSLHRGILTRNWMVLQNELKSRENIMHKDQTWLRNVIRALWDFSHNVWVARCKHVHIKNEGDICSMTHEELVQIVRDFLSLSRKTLSSVERKLHLNITKKLRYAHSSTLVRWIHLLKNERARTEKDEGSLRVTKRIQTITRFFKPRNIRRLH